MNKLEGFYALQNSGLPFISWSKYSTDTYLDPNILWTIRTAVEHGDDLNLPRLVGVTAYEAHSFARNLLGQLTINYLIIYYPYFIAKKSGVIEISNNRVVIEAVNEDLWNLVTDNKRDVTIIFEDDDIQFIGDQEFISQAELLELVDYCVLCKRKFSGFIGDGHSVFLEWSIACNSDINRNSFGNPYFIFYEIRTV
jgi:hypothetical protein